MEFLYGKLNKQVELQEYKGISTKTIAMSVDNSTHTISAEFIGNIPNTVSDLNALVFDKDQLLTNEQLEQLYKNININNYLNEKVILKEKENQSLLGNLLIYGNLGADKLFTNGEITFNKYDNTNNATLTVDKNGNLVFSNYTHTGKILGADNLVANKFVLFNGEYLTTRSIQVSDIVTTNYDPETNKDLTTKEYVDRAVRQSTNYGIVANYDSFRKVTAWPGRRIHIIECDFEDVESHTDNYGG